MGQIFLVGIGGCLGAIARFKLGAWILHASSGWKFPIGTFSVNVLGCCVAGILTGVLENQQTSTASLRIFLFTGVLGGFTTFSAFGVETIALLRRGDLSIALANVVLTVGVALAALWLGLKFSSIR
jgi:CrcB protein